MSSHQIVRSLFHSASHVTRSKALFQKRMVAEEFCLKWNDHHSAFFSAAEELLEQVKTISNFKMRSGIVYRSLTDICAGDLGRCDVGHWQVLLPRPPPCPLHLLHLLSQVPHSKWNIRKLENQNSCLTWFRLFSKEGLSAANSSRCYYVYLKVRLAPFHLYLSEGAVWQKLFTRTFQDISEKHLQMLISFMYRGEINCEEHDLPQFIAAARWTSATIISCNSKTIQDCGAWP